MIDWNNLPVLEAPRRARTLSERYDRERLAGNKHAKRKRPKNHATKKDIALLAQAKAYEQHKALTAYKDARRLRLALCRAYWRGESDGHP